MRRGRNGKGKGRGAGGKGEREGEWGESGRKGAGGKGEGEGGTWSEAITAVHQGAVLDLCKQLFLKFACLKFHILL